MNTKHTPGPSKADPWRGEFKPKPRQWKATVNRYPDGTLQSRPYVTDENGDYVCECFKNDLGPWFAGLIAEAPELARQRDELAEALGDCCEALEAEMWVDEEGAPKWTRVALDNARAVLAKLSTPQ